MNNRELTRQVQALKGLIERTRTACGDDLEMQSHWAKYLCVLVAGFLENSLNEVYSDFCRRAASKPVANFAMSALSRIQNPKTNAFIEVATAFNKGWGAAIEAFLEDGGRKEAINSIMSNRHQIAHGRDSTITVARVNEYFLKCVGVVEFVEDQCK